MILSLPGSGVGTGDLIGAGLTDGKVAGKQRGGRLAAPASAKQPNHDTAGSVEVPAEQAANPAPRANPNNSELSDVVAAGMFKENLPPRHTGAVGGWNRG